MRKLSRSGSAEWTVLYKTQHTAPVIEVRHSHLSLFIVLVVTRECLDSDWVSSDTGLTDKSTMSPSHGRFGLKVSSWVVAYPRRGGAELLSGSRPGGGVR